MKQPIHMLLAFILLLSIGLHAQQAPAKNLVIFVMDGYRWQELYQGADSSILFDKQYNHNDSAWTVTKYWDKDQQ